ncbi:hypothetical protein EW146_g6427 [Bondarzewia mesenterica]|uniref:Uncharacterized protein n=1 Tax=Bondarzewia mesenterica TaxID=1095465 RepID=A0A4V3XEI9_9AGAM|nr:hypothetical protein EW146_g6427 [Bondarzewia mesenterica]
MVVVLLSSPQGNTGSRYFPYHGYLGLTPLTVRGIVRTKLDPDGKPLLAKSLTVAVRCYEARTGRRGTIHSNVLAEYVLELWHAPPASEFAPLADSEHTFRIAIPRDAPGFSTAYFQDYRMFWRVEAGTYAHLLMTRSDSESVSHPIQSSPTSISWALVLGSSSLPSFLWFVMTFPLRCPRRHHSRRTSSRTKLANLGRLPSATISPSRQLPSALLTSSLSASVFTQQTRPSLYAPPASPSSAGLNSEKTSPPPLHHPRRYPQLTLSPLNAHDSFLSLSRTSSSTSITPPPSPLAPGPASSFTLDTLSTAPTITTSSSQYPLLGRHRAQDRDLQSSPTLSNSNGATYKVINSTVAGAESSSGRFVRDPQSGVWSRTMTLQWPAARSSTRWALGETMTTELVRVRFFVKVKIIVSSPSGTDSIDLLEQPLTVISTNASERQLAITKFNAALATTRSSSKSKSPHRTTPAPPSPTPVPPLKLIPLPQPSPLGDRRWREGDESTKEREGKRKRESRAPTRPHTSAGPRDRKKESGGRGMEMMGASAGGVWRPGTASAGSSRLRGGSSVGMGMGTTGTGHGPGIAAVVGIGGMQTVRINTVTGITTTHPQASGGAASPDHVRAWEEELARIEAQSRRSSVGLARAKMPLLGLGRTARKMYGEVVGGR